MSFILTLTVYSRQKTKLSAIWCNFDLCLYFVLLFLTMVLPLDKMSMSVRRFDGRLFLLCHWNFCPTALKLAPILYLGSSVLTLKCTLSIDCFVLPLLEYWLHYVWRFVYILAFTKECFLLLQANFKVFHSFLLLDVCLFRRNWNTRVDHLWLIYSKYDLYR